MNLYVNVLRKPVAFKMVLEPCILYYSVIGILMDAPSPRHGEACCTREPVKMSGMGRRAVEIYCSDKTASGEEKERYRDTR